VGENEFTGNVDDNYEWNMQGKKWIKKKDMPFTRGHASSSTNPVNCGFMISAGSTNEFGKTKYVHAMLVRAAVLTTFRVASFRCQGREFLQHTYQFVDKGR